MGLGHAYFSAPPGVTPNFVDPSDNLHTPVYVTIGLGFGLPTLFLAARIYTRVRVVRVLACEDYALAISRAFFAAFRMLCLITVPRGGIHMWDTHVRDLIDLLHVSKTFEILYNPAIIFLKAAILLQYLRIFVPWWSLNRAMWYGCHLVLWTNVVFYVAIMLVQIFSCYPREKAWNILLQEHCLNINAILLSSAIFNCVSDVVILALPQYSIWRLRMNGTQKLWVSVVFGLGILACLVSAFRIQFVLQLLQTLDFSWHMASTAMWGIAEIGLGIICSRCSVMPLFFRKVTGRLSGWNLGRYECSRGLDRLENARRKTIWHDKDLTLVSNSSEESSSTVRTSYSHHQGYQSEKPSPAPPCKCICKPLTATSRMHSNAASEEDYTVIIREIEVPKDWRRDAGYQISIV